jgi:uncharacterized protein YhhL (DUF1145 family)
MKLLQWFLAFFIVAAIGFSTVNVALADDDYEHERYEHHWEDDENESPFEEAGNIAGWVTFAAMGAAGILFPARRLAKTVIKEFASAKNLVVSLNKFLGKGHVLFGLFALVFALVHGMTMFLDEGKLEGDGAAGLSAAIFMFFSGIFGMILLKNKKSKMIRNVHMVLIGISLCIALFHIFFS